VCGLTAAAKAAHAEAAALEKPRQECLPGRGLFSNRNGTEHHTMSEQKLKALEATASTTTVAPDPFDLKSLTLDQNFFEASGVKKLLRTVPTRRPHHQDFIRVRPDPEFRANILTVDLKEDREVYLVRPEIAPELTGETSPKTIFTAINKQGVLFLWPVPIPPPDTGRINEWWRSSREAAELAMSRWLRIRANMSLGAYEMFEAEGVMAEPEWPSLTFQELLKVSFRDRMIDRVDHPVIQRLRGLS
jgi:hypothetical protein